MSTGAKVVAWRYRVGGDGRFEPGPWKLVYEEAECNPQPQYERQPLVLQADHLAELQAIPRLPEWRSVEEEVPEDPGEETSYLVAVEGEVEPWMAYFDFNEQWRDTRTEVLVSELTGGRVVTHWMPLPAPPRPRPTTNKRRGESP